MSQVLLIAAMAASLFLSGPVRGKQRQSPPKSAGASGVPNPVAVLVRDSGVRAELRMTASQQEAVDALLAEFNEPLLAMRDLSAEQWGEPVQKVIADFESRLGQILDSQQAARLDGLIVQAQGLAALERPEIARRLDFTSAQQSQFTRILASIRAARDELQKKAAAGADPKAVQERLEQLKRTEHEGIVGLWTEPQKRGWLELVGPKYDFSTLGYSAGKAPELRDVTEWVQSDPLMFEQLRGQVVVLHFFAFQ